MTTKKVDTKDEQKNMGKNITETHEKESGRKAAKGSSKSGRTVHTSASKKTKSPTDKLKEKLKHAEKTGHEWHDKYLRLSAEFDNYRKRTMKEKSELTKIANENLLSNILPVIDDFERGLSTMDNAASIEGVKEGILLIYNKFREFLTQNGVKEIEADHKEFNIDLHEAITKIPAPSEELKGKIVDVIEKGYILNDKVIRYSKVVIGE